MDLYRKVKGHEKFYIRGLVGFFSSLGVDFILWISVANLSSLLVSGSGWNRINKKTKQRKAKQNKKGEEADHSDRPETK